jgi:hypothetical protein
MSHHGNGLSRFATLPRSSFPCLGELGEPGDDGPSKAAAWRLWLNDVYSECTQGESFEDYFVRFVESTDSEIQDEIAEAVARAPVVARLESLALSMGALSDEGAEALLSGRSLTHLHELDLRHHFLSRDMAERLAIALPGVRLVIGPSLEPYEWSPDERYVAVSE